MHPFGINIHTLLYVKQKTDKDLLNSTGNYMQYLATTYKEKEHIYISESLCCTPETNTIVNQLYFN